MHCTSIRPSPSALSSESPTRIAAKRCGPASCCALESKWTHSNWRRSPARDLRPTRFRVRSSFSTSFRRLRAERFFAANSSKQIRLYSSTHQDRLMYEAIDYQVEATTAIITLDRPDDLNT